MVVAACRAAWAAWTCKRREPLHVRPTRVGPEGPGGRLPGLSLLLVGLGATALFTFLVSMLARSGGLPMGFPLGWVVAVGVLLMAISLASGLMALGILKKSQPADLLR